MSVLARILYFIFFSFLNPYFNSQGFGLAATIVFILAFVAVIPPLSKLTRFNVVHHFFFGRFFEASTQNETEESNEKVHSETIVEGETKEEGRQSSIKTEETTIADSKNVKQLIMDALDTAVKEFISDPPTEAYSSGDGYFSWYVHIKDSDDNRLTNNTEDDYYDERFECSLVKCDVGLLEDVVMNDSTDFSEVENNVRDCFRSFLENSNESFLDKSADKVDLSNSYFQVVVYEVTNSGEEEWVYYQNNHYFDATEISSNLSSNKSAIKKVTRDPYDFNKLDDIFKSDKEVVMAAVTGHGDNLEYAADSLKADKEVVLAAINNSGSALRFSADNLKEDPEILIASLRNYGSLEHFPDHLKANKKFVLGTVAIDGENLEYASDELKADKEIVRVAIKNTSRSLEYASEALRADREIVLEAMKNGGVDFRYIDEKFKADKEVVLEAVKSDNNLLYQISDELKADKEIYVAAVESDNGTFHVEHAPDSLKADKEFILSIIQSDEYGFNVLEHASDEIKSDKELILSIIQSYEYGYDVFRYISDDLKEDKDFTIEAIKTNPECFEHIARAFKNDKGIVLEYISNIKNKNECEIPEKYRTDKDVVLADLKNQGTLLGEAAEIGIDVDKELFLSILNRKLSDSEEYYAKSSENRSDSGGVLWGILKNGFPDKFKADKEIMMFVIKNDYLCLRFVSPELLQDEEILYEAIKKGRLYSIKEYISDSFKADKEFISSASKINPDIISLASEEVMADHSLIDYWVKNGEGWLYKDIELIREYKANKDLVLPLVKAYGDRLEHVSKELKADKDIVMAAVSNRGLALEYASGELQADKEVVLAAINDDKDAIKYASWTLLTDKDFMLSI